MGPIDQIIHLRRSYPRIWDGSIDESMLIYDIVVNNVKIELARYLKHYNIAIDIEIIKMNKEDFDKQVEFGSISEYIYGDGPYL